jgi:hypothetical protein
MDDIVAEGREAWKRIGVATSFEAWLTVAKAVAIGRQHAMREAGANSPHGSKYRVAINNWLEANGFREMPYGIRKACCAMVDNLQAIEAWLASLPEKERAGRRHPEVVVRNWRRATRPAWVPKRRRCAAKLKPKRQQIIERAKAAGDAARQGRSVFWGQDHLRRAHRAMLASRSTDLLTLARLALQGAIRNEDDLLALLDGRRDRKGEATRRSMLRHDRSRPARTCHRRRARQADGQAARAALRTGALAKGGRLRPSRMPPRGPVRRG